MTDSDAIIESDHDSQADLHKTVVRIVAGGIGEGIDRLMRASAELDEADEDPDAGLAFFRADPTLMAAVGWVSEIPDLVRGIGDTTYRMSYPMVRVAAIAIDTTAYVAQATGVSAFIDGFTTPFREAYAQERQRLVAVGTAEYARGRVLATYAFEQSVDGIVGLLSESEELGDLVREQTIGITGSAVQEMRETGAAADGLSEGLFRKLLRRSARPLPPTPVEDT